MANYKQESTFDPYARVRVNATNYRQLIPWGTNIISIARGDSFEIPIYINAGDKFRIHQYILEPEDKVYISIAEPNQPWEFSLIKKILTTKDFNYFNDVVFKLEPTDTEKVVPGKYYLEGKILMGNGRVYTILPKKQF